MRNENKFLFSIEIIQTNKQMVTNEGTINNVNDAHVYFDLFTFDFFFHFMLIENFLCSIGSICNIEIGMDMNEVFFSTFFIISVHSNFV